ncbi:hypothetical protein UK23_29590 [Lentzea aerocolonigenes]|uniref:Uncharacterized protein n=1 Tax=Lentzea aerocolonigenes TaxID=68170 RepID=A0A0F0GSH8_LENAE|nr:hypothetical protein [Lentzea aerocolonigenes]KJK44378.1 hypothetical protein UK23_29590 [Lentzea aerocolonigenes]
MPFDLASIAASAIVGGFSGVLFASWKIRKEESAKRRALARDRVQDAAGSVLTEAVAYQAGYGRRRVPAPSLWMPADYKWASMVIEASRGLGWLRKWLLQHRLRHLLGPLGYDLVTAKPAMEGDDLMAGVLAAVFKADPTEDPNGVPTGFLAVAMQEPRDSKEVTKLVRILKRVSRTRII